MTAKFTCLGCGSDITYLYYRHGMERCDECRESVPPVKTQGDRIKALEDRVEILEQNIERLNRNNLFKWRW